MALHPEVVVPAAAAEREPKRGWAALACLVIGGASASVAVARTAITGSNGSLALASIPLIACFWLAVLSAVRREKRPLSLAAGLGAAVVGAFFGLPLLVLASLAVLGLIALLLQ